jgi:Tfp pilus assembly protein PilN
MSQQINLINPSLIKKKDFLTIVNIGVVYGVFCVLMLSWFVYANNQVSVLNKEQTALAGELDQLNTSLTQMTAARVPHAPDASLQMQVAKLEAIEQVQTQILTVINQDKSQAMSLDKYMHGLASQTIDGLWLTGFSIDQKAHTVTLRGRSLSADALPVYMKKLGSEPVFNGQLFGGLQIQQPTQASVTNAADTSAEASAVAPQFVEFELKGLEVEPNAVVANNTQEKVKS